MPYHPGGGNRIWSVQNAPTRKKNENKKKFYPNRQSEPNKCTIFATPLVNKVSNHKRRSTVKLSHIRFRVSQQCVRSHVKRSKYRPKMPTNGTIVVPDDIKYRSVSNLVSYLRRKRHTRSELYEWRESENHKLFYQRRKRTGFSFRTFWNVFNNRR